MALVRAAWHKVGFGRRELFNSAPRASVSRRATIARGAIALVAACALAACGTDPDPDSELASHAGTELGKMIDDAPEIVIADEPLNAGLLRHFYARHGFEPIWTTRQAQAHSLVRAVLHAGDQGLDPGLFHANLLRHGSKLSPLDRDLVLSDAFLSYAGALARGAVPVERRGDDQTLTPGPIDVPAALDDAISSPDPAAAIEALAPTTPTYQALRKALQRYRSGILAGNEATPNRLREIVVNLERQRWLPRPLPADRVWVNVADEEVVLYRAGEEVFSSRVVVGQDVKENQSPEFLATINGIIFNPPWRIPDDIAAREILPILSHDPNYLIRNKIVTLPDGGLQQLAGPDAGLGLLMFDMPNRFDVYLHDTPDKYLFKRDNRRVSHGCIRVHDPRELAALLMQQPIDAINEEIATGTTSRSDLPTRIPVFVVYQTAFADADGTLQFRPDFYDRDPEIWRQLHRRRDQVPQADNVPTARGRLVALRSPTESISGTF
jgi:L,D-transpeptidase YcbB